MTELATIHHSIDTRDAYWEAEKEYCWGYPSRGGTARGGSVEFPGISLEDKGWGKYNGWGQFKPTLDIYEEMAKDNVPGAAKNERLAATILEYGDEFEFFGETRKFWSAVNVEAGFQIYKFLQPFAPADCQERGWVLNNPDWPCTLINWPIVRFADCLLLRAEAYLVAGNGAAAAADINRIRERCHLQPLTGDATWTDLYHERRCELAFEMANPFIMAASTTTAVPCWSSWKIGISHTCFNLLSISKHLGAEISSKLTPPNEPEIRLTVFTISSTSVVRVRTNTGTTDFSLDSKWYSLISRA